VKATLHYNIHKQATYKHSTLHHYTTHSRVDSEYNLLRSNFSDAVQNISVRTILLHTAPHEYVYILPH